MNENDRNAYQLKWAILGVCGLVLGSMATCTVYDIFAPAHLSHKDCWRQSQEDSHRFMRYADYELSEKTLENASMIGQCGETKITQFKPTK